MDKWYHASSHHTTDAPRDTVVEDDFSNRRNLQAICLRYTHMAPQGGRGGHLTSRYRLSPSRVTSLSLFLTLYLPLLHVCPNTYGGCDESGEKRSPRALARTAIVIYSADKYSQRREETHSTSLTLTSPRQGNLPGNELWPK